MKLSFSHSWYYLKGHVLNCNRSIYKGSEVRCSCLQTQTSGSKFLVILWGKSCLEQFTVYQFQSVQKCGKDSTIYIQLKLKPKILCKSLCENHKTNVPLVRCWYLLPPVRYSIPLVQSVGTRRHEISSSDSKMELQQIKV